MTTFTIHTEDKEQVKALKALKIKFEMSKEEKPYNDKFIAKIEKGRKEIAEGKSTKVSIDKLDEFLGL